MSSEFDKLFEGDDEVFDDEDAAYVKEQSAMSGDVLDSDLEDALEGDSCVPPVSGVIFDTKASVDVCFPEEGEDNPDDWN